MHILGEMVPDVETEMGERVRAMSFVVGVTTCMCGCLMKSRESWNGCKAAVVREIRGGRTSDRVVDFANRFVSDPFKD